MQQNYNDMNQHNYMYKISQGTTYVVDSIL